MVSSEALARCLNSGPPSSAISSAIQPMPTPTVIRPFESTSSVASILADSTGWRCGSTNTEDSNRILLVALATKLSAVIVSSETPVSWAKNLPVSE